MIWFIGIVLIIFFTFRSDFLRDNLDDFLDWAVYIMVSSIIAFLISLVPLGLWLFIGSIPERVGVKAAEFELIALKDRDGFSGRFYFLGMGTLNDEQYYFWYRKNKDGSISGGKTPRHPEVLINELDDIGAKPIMVTYKTVYTNKLVQKYIWLIGYDRSGQEESWPRFIIPKGSIKQDITL